jgi:hypothetical protein
MNIKAVLRGTLEQLKLLHQALDHPATMHMVRMISVNLEEAYIPPVFQLVLARVDSLPFP